MQELFDSHVHYEEPLSVEKSIPVFEGIFRCVNVKKINFMSVPHLNGVLDAPHNVKALFFKNYFAPNAYAFAGLEHDLSLDDGALAECYLKQVQKYVEVGYDGIKLLEGKPTLRRVFKRKLSDPVYDPTYSFLEETGTPITLHNAEPSEFWDITKVSAYAIEHGWNCAPPRDLSKEEMHEDVFEVMRKHPKLHLTLAHFGFMCDAPERAERFLGDYEHTMFDTTTGGYEYHHMDENLDYWLDFLHRFSTRIKFGTDTTNVEIADPSDEKCVFNAISHFGRKWLSTSETLYYYPDKPIVGANLDQALLDKIFMQNALTEYGAPKKLNRAYFFAEIERLKRVCKEDESAIADLRFMETHF